MVRNNRRKAFTIVELVIVIAVIAILAAVMIPTFTGIIKRANISADQQLAASINTQLSIYKADGNKIETEADLLAALTSDEDFTAHLNPKSAKHGYHYWYDAAEQTVKLLSNDQVIVDSANLRERVQAQVFAAGGDGVAEAAFNPLDFAHAAPRTIVPGFYFLDQIGENENVIAEVFNTLANMSNLTKTEYKGAIDALTAVKGENKGLADKVLERISKTAIMTDKGVFINTNNNSINYIYVPTNNTENKDGYYLNHTVHHASSNEVTTFVADLESGVIELPKDVKVAEGSFVNLGAITVKVATDKVADLENILCADAVHTSATVVLNNGASYKTNGSIVTDAITSAVQDVTLPCRNPITGFVTGTSNDSNAVGSYIALDKINNGITLNLTTGQFTAKDPSLPAYENIIWSVKGAKKGDTTISAENAKVTVTANGVVTFLDGFNADEVTFTATATAGGKAIDHTLNVVTFDKVTTTFSNGATATLDSTNTVTSNKTLFVSVSADTTANFTEDLAYIYSGVPFTSEQLATLGVAPTVTITTTPNYFSKDALYTAGFVFNMNEIQKLTGGFDMQAVTITANVANGVSYSGTVDIKVKDNTNSPYESALPKYKAELKYTYKVGNDKLPISEIFAKKETVGGDISDHKIFVFDEKPTENYFYDAIDGYDFTKDTEFDFTKNVYTVGKTYYLVVGTTEIDEQGNPLVSEDENVSAIVMVELVNGLNVLGDADFRTPAAGVGLVLHNNFTNTKNEDTVVKLVGASIYGNYFTVTADKYIDNDGKNGEGSDTTDGYSFIAVSGGTAANPSTINQLIINGPVYRNPAMEAANTGIAYENYFNFATNPDGNFCNGINADGGYVVINDSYIYGFNSTVRVNGGSFKANGTIFEGGAWSNILIANATEFVLTDCITLQKQGGYDPTIHSSSKKTVGMGIYVHETLSSQLTIELNNTKQYNWLPESIENVGLFLDLATQEIFSENSAAANMNFYHTVNGTRYVNCTVLSLGVHLKADIVVKQIDKKVNATDKFDVSVSGGYEYTGEATQNPTEITIIDLDLWFVHPYVKADVTCNVHSYGCDTNCGCASEIKYVGGITEFLKTKIN